jgi:hypothetical protein
MKRRQLIRDEKEEGNTWIERSLEQLETETHVCADLNSLCHTIGTGSANDKPHNMRRLHRAESASDWYFTTTTLRDDRPSPSSRAAQPLPHSRKSSAGADPILAPTSIRRRKAENTISRLETGCGIRAGTNVRGKTCCAGICCAQCGKAQNVLW